MHLERLRYLAAVARTGSVRGAAAALHVTPGAVSKALAKLEHETGVPLLVPEGRGVSLTHDGRWLARRAEQLVGDAEALGRDLANRRTRDPGICLAAYDVFATWFPAQLATRFLPKVPLSVRERWPGEVEDAVATGLSDVGITFIPVPTEGIEHEEAARVELGVYALRGTFDNVSFDELPFVVPSHPIHGSVGRYGPLDGWPVDAPPRHAPLRASSLEARLELARSGAAVVLIPTFVAQMHNRRAPARTHLELVPLPRGNGRLTRRIYVVRRTATTGPVTERINAVQTAVSAVCDDVS